jgi:hypothetical protein
MKSLARISSTLLYLPVAILAGASVFADEITLDGEVFSDVYIRETSGLFYVQFPEDGTIRSAVKSDAGTGNVTFSEESERAKLLARWRQARAANKAPLPVVESAHETVDTGQREAGRLISAPRDSAKSEGNDGARTHRRAARANTGPFALIESNGRQVYVNLRRVPLRVALKTILRSMNLDYAVKNGIVWISTPKRIRSESFDKLETRYYQLSATAVETLPKIVIRNPGGAANLGAGGFGEQSEFGGGQSSGGFGGQQGGFGGGGGFGGQQGGFGGGGIGLSNISQLFFNIDDRMVGERPNLISQLYGGP